MKRIIFFLAFLISTAFAVAAPRPSLEISEAPQKTKKSTSRPPQYADGGEMQLMKDLSRTIKYPAECIDQNVQGVVIVSFTVSSKGKLKGVMVRQSSGNELLDKEAVRAVKALPGKWSPALEKGRRVSANFALPVSFKLR